MSTSLIDEITIPAGPEAQELPANNPAPPVPCAASIMSTVSIMRVAGSGPRNSGS